MPSIERKYWHLIPVYPKFGSLIDEAGGRSRPLNREDLCVSINTVVGMTEISSKEDEIKVNAKDIGIELHYKKNGVLDNFGLDVFDYCINSTEVNYEKMGGQVLDKFMETLFESNKYLSIGFDLNNNEITVTSSDELSDNKDLISTVISKDLSIPTIVAVNIGEYRMMVGCSVEEDEFAFGILVKNIDDQLTMDTEVFMCSILRDCNFKTFLKSNTQDKYERLVKRIFFV